MNILLGNSFNRYKNMNSSFVALTTLVKSDTREKSLINILMNISTQALKDYLKSANICKGNVSKKKTDLLEIIVYGCINDKLNKKSFRRYINKTSKSNIK